MLDANEDFTSIFQHLDCDFPGDQNCQNLLHRQIQSAYTRRRQPMSCLGSHTLHKAAALSHHCSLQVNIWSHSVMTKASTKAQGGDLWPGCSTTRVSAISLYKRGLLHRFRYHTLTKITAPSHWTLGAKTTHTVNSQINNDWITTDDFQFTHTLRVRSRVLYMRINELVLGLSQAGQARWVCEAERQQWTEPSESIARIPERKWAACNYSGLKNNHIFHMLFNVNLPELFYTIIYVCVYVYISCLPYVSTV